jgi:phospholipid/cholesterol/gamma-HCH transport system substrate-binding protein
VNAQVAPIKAKAENLLSSMDSVMTVFREVFNQKTKENLQKSFASISNALHSIEAIAFNVDTMMGKQNGRLKQIFDNVASITSNIKDNNEKISKAINNFATISDTIAKANLGVTIENLKLTLEQTAKIFDKVNKGEGTLGKLAGDDSLYINLNATARDLDILIKDLKANPKKYVHFSMF